MARYSLLHAVSSKLYLEATLQWQRQLLNTKILSFILPSLVQSIIDIASQGQSIDVFFCVLAAFGIEVSVLVTNLVGIS